ncbi:MAG: metallophosphoesterase [Roseburia sp.]|nr:metallophosphoesterase [Roseburia sp.]
MRQAEVGAIIKKYREMRGVTADELSKELYLRSCQVAIWERGLDQPDSRLIKTLVNVLKIPDTDADILLQKNSMLSIDTEELTIPGIKKKYQFLHISDLHVIVPDEDESVARIEYELPRISNCFSRDAINPLERMQAFCSYINANKKELDGVFFTGDIIDCPFMASIQYIKETLESLPIPYMYVLGNHDWQHFDNVGTDDSVKNNHPLFDVFCNGNAYFQKKQIGELTLIGVDNTRDCYFDTVADALEAEISGNEHVILLQHVPFYSPTLVDDCKLFWSGHAFYIGNDGDARNNNIRILNRITAEDSSVRALITGHLHFHHKDMLKNKIPQYITKESSCGGATLYKIHG